MSGVSIDQAAAKAAFTAMFAGEKSFQFGGETYPVDILKSNNLKAVIFGEYQCIEQNPRKDSQWAQKARESSRSMSYEIDLLHQPILVFFLDVLYLA
jgi:hypothetical protein